MDVFVYYDMEMFYSLVTNKDELNEIKEVDLNFGSRIYPHIIGTNEKFPEYVFEIDYLEFDRDNRMLSVKIPHFRFFKKTVYRKKVRKIFAPMSIKKVYINGKKLYNPVTNVLHLIIF